MAVLAHPDRVRILRHLLTHDTAAPADLARAWEEDLSRLSYHFRRLEMFGAIECRRRTQERGAFKHHYALRDREAVAYALRLAEVREPAARRAVQAADEATERGDRALRTVALWVGRLRERREQLGLTIAELARRSGVDAGTLRRVEHRESDPRSSVLIAMAEAMDYPLTELVAGPPDDR